MVGVAQASFGPEPAANENQSPKAARVHTIVDAFAGNLRALQPLFLMNAVLN